MRQRVAFARTLLSGKPVLCLDEPFGALDAITRSEMQEWLASALAREPRTTVLVTHDVDEAILLADRVVVLTDGELALDTRIDVAHPRDRSDPAFIELRNRLLRELGVEEIDVRAPLRHVLSDETTEPTGPTSRIFQ